MNAIIKGIQTNMGKRVFYRFTKEEHKTMVMLSYMDAHKRAEVENIFGKSDTKHMSKIAKIINAYNKMYDKADCKKQFSKIVDKHNARYIKKYNLTVGAEEFKLL